MKRLRGKNPPIGMRIIKSAIAVMLCFCVSFIRGNSGIVFYSQLAALWCMQVYVSNTRKNAAQRMIGTVIGAIYGLVFLLIKRGIAMQWGDFQMIDAAVISLMLVIYYGDTQDKIQQKLISDLRKSPYRNYVKRELPETEYVVYFMLLYPKAVIESFYKVLEKNNLTKELKVLKYDSQDYPGYAYIKIYNKNATKTNMICYLKEMLGIDKTVTFGSIEGKYDVVVQSGDTNEVVHILKKLYEPFKRPFRSKIKLI